MSKQLAVILSSMALSGLAVSAYAFDIDNAGFYAGTQLGYGWVHTKNQAGMVTRKGKHANSFMARFYGGYSLNKYLSAEVGYTYLGSYETRYLNVNLKRKIFAIDAMVKLSYPFNNKFFVYGEGGGAYVHTEYTPRHDGSAGIIRPKAGVGIGYNLSSTASLNISYSRIFGTGNPVSNNGTVNKKYLPNIDMLAVGLTFRF